MTRRDRIGLLAFVVVAGSYGAFYLAQPSRPTSSTGDAPMSFESLLLDDPGPGPRGTPRDDRPPLLPPVKVADDVVATLWSIDAFESFGDPFAAFGRAPATRPDATSRPARQMIVARVGFQDPRTTHDQDHAIRIAGRPARTMRTPHLSGAAGPMSFATVLVDPALKRVPIEVGIASGSFVEFERMSLGDAAPQRAEGAPAEAPMQLRSLEAGRGELLVHLTAPAAGGDAFADQSWLLQAFCRDGRVLMPFGFRLESADGGVARIRVDPKDVDYVVYHYRPYVWQRLGEVDVPAMRTMPTWPGRPPQTSTAPTMPPSPEVERRMRERRSAAISATAPS